MSGLMNEEQLKASLDAPNRKVTILSADYKAAIFKDYNINYTFEENLPWSEHAPMNFHCLKHVFHPFNYPTIIFDTTLPYRRLMDKILNGHELRIELSIDNTGDSVRLLRLCQCLLGATYIHSTGGDIYDDHYCRPRDEKGTIPVPYIIGKCSGLTESLPAWSFYWDISDKIFWSVIEDKLTKPVSQFSGILFSREDRDLIFELLGEIACTMFNHGKDIETKKIEGPGYLDVSKWEGILIGLYQEFRSMSSVKNGGLDLCSAVLAAFRCAFYAEPYSRFCIKEIKANSSTPAHDVYECRDLADVPITGYSQRPNVTDTDLAIPDAFAVDYRIGITIDFAKSLNQQQEEMTRGRCTNRIVYSECAPSSTDTYVEDDLGNIIAFKQQLGKGRIIVYPRGMEDCITKLCGTDVVIACDNSQKSNSFTLSKSAGNAEGDGDTKSGAQTPSKPISPHTTTTNIPLLNIAITKTAKKVKFDIIVNEEDNKTTKATRGQVLKFLVMYAVKSTPETHLLFQHEVEIIVQKGASRSSHKFSLNGIFNSNANYNTDIERTVKSILSSQENIIKNHLSKEGSGDYPTVGTYKEVILKNIHVVTLDIEAKKAIEEALIDESISAELKDFILKPFSANGDHNQA